jgi:hypothetical protein
LQPVGEGGLINTAAALEVLARICGAMGSSPMGGGERSIFSWIFEWVAAQEETSADRQRLCSAC